MRDLLPRLLSSLVLGAGMGCSEPDSPDAEAGPIGEVTARGVIRAPTGDRPDGRLRGSFQVRLDRRLEPRSWLRLDQGYVEDGHEMFGPTVRYRLPALEADLLGVAICIGATLHTEHGDARPCPIRPLVPEEGWFAVYLADGADAGSTIELVLGPPELPGPRTPSVPIEVELHAFVSTLRGDERLAGSVSVRVVDPEVDWLRVLGPASVKADTPILWTLCFMSGFSGPRRSAMVAPIPAEVTVEVRVGDRWLPLTLGHTEPVDESLPSALTLATPALPPGVHRLAFRARAGDSEWHGLSAPVEVGASDRLLFGSLHNHSSLGGHATSTPRRTLRYARDISRLDFCGLTEHAESPLLDWAWLQSLEESESRPESFVTFVGFEWTHAIDGHRHVVYRRAVDRVPLAASDTPPPAEGVAVAHTLEALADVVGDDPGALVAVHHPLWFGGVAQRAYRYGDPGLMPRQRLGEVYSWHGSSFGGAEAFPIHDSAAHRMNSAGNGILAALAQGHDFRLVADADNHLGRPGSLVGVVWEKARRYAYQGLIALRVESFGRDEVFAALDGPSAHGTTGARMHLHPRHTPGGGVELRVHATAPLRSIALHTPHGVLGTVDFEDVTPDEGTEDAPLFLDPSVGVWDHECRFEASRGLDTPLWVEVIQQDRHRAWYRVH